jgi:hypothetical protein
METPSCNESRKRDAIIASLEAGVTFPKAEVGKQPQTIQRLEAMVRSRAEWLAQSEVQWESRVFSAHPDSLLLPAIKWGSPDVLFTPAYWAHLALRHRNTTKADDSFRLGTTFKEECVACLLGGHGIPGDVGNAAFRALVDAGLTASASPSVEDVLKVLRKPLPFPDGRKVRYRFAASKSAYVAAVLNSNPTPPSGLSERGVRDWLTQFPGIGLKTASWIVRNWYASDEVAIIDIHIYRAGLLAGFFEPESSLSRDYRMMERRFLAFAAAIGFRPSHLDAVIWLHMRQANRLAVRCIRDYITDG